MDLKSLTMLVKDSNDYRLLHDFVERVESLHDDGYYDVCQATLPSGMIRKLRHRVNGRVVVLSIIGRTITQKSCNRIVYTHTYD